MKATLLVFLVVCVLMALPEFIYQLRHWRADVRDAVRDDYEE